MKVSKRLKVARCELSTANTQATRARKILHTLRTGGVVQAHALHLAGIRINRNLNLAAASALIIRRIVLHKIKMASRSAGKMKVRVRQLQKMECGNKRARKPIDVPAEVVAAFLPHFDLPPAALSADEMEKR